MQCGVNFSVVVVLLCFGAVFGHARESNEPAEPEQTEQSETSDTSDEMIHEMPSDMPPGVFTLGVMGNDEEVEGFGNVLVPVYYDGESTLLFVTPRFTAGDNDEEELNVGIGGRYLFPHAHVIIGANAFYDYRWTENDSEWSQYGFGVELLTEWVDARANYYLPEDDKELVDEYETVETSTSSSTDVDYGGIYAQGNGLYQEIVTTRRTTKTTVTKTFRQWEAALEGYDAEIGVKLPYISDIAETRVFVGYQSFDNPFGEDMEGAKGRLEVRALPGLYLDAELYENEDLNGADYAVGARLNLPLDLAGAAHGENPFAGAGHNFDPSSDQRFVNRMTEMVIRDLKIRTSRSEFEEAVDMRTTDTDTDTDRDEETITVMNELTFVDQDNAGDPLENGTAEHPYDVIDEGINTATSLNHAVYVFDAATPYNDNVVLPDGLTAYGSGMRIEGLAGRTFGGIYPVVNGRHNGPTFILGNNVVLAGFDIQNDDPGPGSGPTTDPIFGMAGYREVGVYAGNVSGFVMRDNIVNNSGRGVLLVSNTPDFEGTILRNRIVDNTEEGLRIEGVGSSGIMDFEIKDNTIMRNAAHGLYVSAGSFETARLRASGNRLNMNSSNGAEIVVSQNLLTDLVWSDNTTSGNLGDGIYIDGDGTIGAGETFSAFISGTANHNGGLGLGVSARNIDQIGLTVQQSEISGNTNGNVAMVALAGFGNTEMILRDVSADDSPAFGIVMNNFAAGIGLGITGEARIRIERLSAERNRDYNLRAQNWSLENHASTIISDSSFDHSTGGFGVRLSNYAFDAFGDGTGGDGTMVISNVTVSDNRTYNLWAENETRAGEAELYVYGVRAHRSVDGYGARLENSAGNSFGGGGSASTVLSGLQVHSNADYGAFIVIDTTIGTASLFGSDNRAVGNGDAGILTLALGAAYDLNLGDAAAGTGGNNVFFDNTGNDLSHAGGGTLRAENNWWGAPADPGARIGGSVDYDPWLLTAP